MGGMVKAYARISKDPNERRVGVERQRREVAELAERLGLTVDQWHEDNDVSAYSGVRRPAFEELLQDVETGRVSALLAWDQDRVARDVTQWERVVKACQAHGVRVAFATAGEIDLGTVSGRMASRFSAVIARHESEHKSERIVAASRQRAAEGKAHGRIPYGYRRVYEVDSKGLPVRGRWRDELDEAAAAVIREAADRVLAGETLKAICRDLEARGVRSSRGATFQTSTLRIVLLRPGNAGLREYRGEIVGDAEAPAILDRAKWERLCRLLRDPKRLTVNDTSTRHLLTGIATCGKCGGPIRAKLNQYQCRDNYCCGRARVPVDELVEDVVVGRLARADARTLWETDDSDAAKAAEEAAGLQARLDGLVDDYADGLLDRAGMKRAADRIRPQLDAARARARATSTAAQDVLEGLTGLEVSQRWETLPIGRKRAVVDLLLDVRIHPVGAGGKGRVPFDPDTIQIDWRAS
jgi:site-specific DNA recombinase